MCRWCGIRLGVPAGISSGHAPLSHLASGGLRAPLGLRGDAGGLATWAGWRAPWGHGKVKFVYSVVEDLIEAEV